MKKALTRSLWLPLMVVVLSANNCKDNGPSVDTGRPFTTELERQISSLEGRWQSDCIENNSTSDETIGENGFYNETLDFADTQVTQTYTYYQDANCTFPVENQLVTEEQTDDTFGEPAQPTVSEENPAEEDQAAEESAFVATISRIMDITYPSGTVATDLGTANYIDLETTSITINDEPLTDEQMLGFGIEVDLDSESALEAFIGIFLVSDNDQLHLSLVKKVDPEMVGSETPRPTEISLTTFYTRIEAEI